MTTVHAASKDKSRDVPEPGEKAAKKGSGASDAKPDVQAAAPSPSGIQAKPQADEPTPRLEVVPPPAVPAGPVDLASLSDAALSALIADAQRELEQRRAKKKSEILAVIGTRFAALVTEALDAGLDEATIESALSKRLRGGKRGSTRARSGVTDGRKNVPPLYRDPQTGDTWTGRGKPKAWVKFGDETNPKTGKPLPLRKFWISEQEKQPT